MNPQMSKHEIYTSCHIPEYQRISFTRFRTGSHFLRVETGRWSRLPRESRTCDCNGVDIQDEEHIIMTCSHLNDLRTGYPSLIFEADHFFNNNTEDSAKFIHEESDRSDKPFVSINCGAIPENLLESELFGHKRGAFTGAVSDKTGKFEAANGGTIFLDEIGDMQLPTQTKILRAIQEGEIQRVGATKIKKVDVRLIAATHKNLEQMVKEKMFREDLYYRLNMM